MVRAPTEEEAEMPLLSSHTLDVPGARLYYEV